MVDGLTVDVFSHSDGPGGAGKAAFRSSLAVNKQGVDVNLFVVEKNSSYPFVKSLRGRGLLADLKSVFRLRFENSPARRAAKSNGAMFSTGRLAGMAGNQLHRSNAKIIHLHWCNGGTLGVEALAGVESKVVWTLHDLWPLSGGCHYDAGCGRFAVGCGLCPQLIQPRPDDLSHRVHQRKIKAWKDLDLTLIAPSRWMGECIKQSSLFRGRRVEIIPNCVDTEVFKPHGQSTARTILNLPTDKFIIGFGATNPQSDPRKGYRHIANMAQELASQPNANNILLVTFGGSTRDDGQLAGIRMVNFGNVNDETTLSLLYSAFDATLVPSEQENHSLVVLESIACGTPVFGFDVGGMRDGVLDNSVGYLAKPFESIAIVRELEALRIDEKRRATIRLACRALAEKEFTIYRHGCRLLDCYKSITGSD